MNEWFKKILEQIKKIWEKISTIQKIILFSLIGVVIIGIILIMSFSATPGMVPLLTSPITDEKTLYEISMRLDQENIEHKITEDGRVLVSNNLTARRMIDILVREDLIPANVSPWDVFKMDKWTVTDFERDVNLREAITRNLEMHIEALDDVDNADVTLVLPEKELFSEDQDPVTASVIITPTPGSNIVTSRKKIEGIVKLIKLAIQGLKDENIVITDYRGNILNDFKGLEDFDRLELTKRQLQQKSDLEKKYKNEILKELMKIFGEDRVRVIKVDIDMDMGKKTVETDEFFL